MHIAGRDVEFIARDEQLPPVLKALAGADRIVVDTEFHTERRYRPELVLVQLARAEGGPIYVVDAQAVRMIGLESVLDGATWIAHGASQDVALLHRRLGCRPAALLDTQLVAGMAGMHFPARLVDLCRDVLGLPLDKASTLSDWTQRPLSTAQLHYAAADVAVLPDLLAALEGRLSKAALRWARMAGEERIAEALAPPDPDRHWRRLRIAHRFDAPTRSVLHQVSAWREEVAAQRNRPPHYVLSGPLLLDLARRKPHTMGELVDNRRLPDRLARQHGAALLELIQRATRAPATVAAVPGPRLQRRARFLELWGAARARHLGIAPALLLDEAQALQAAAAGSLDGWRDELIGAELDRVIQGEIGLRLHCEDVEPLESGPTTTAAEVPPDHENSAKPEQAFR